jgi:hypothetical protein
MSIRLGVSRLRLIRCGAVFAILMRVGLSSATAQVRINEFMANNDAVLQDEDLEYEDWIELHNPSSNAVLLAGWHLTDNTNNLAEWTFPPLALDPGAYLVVFASNKNRTNYPGTLHTDFRLDADGEYLALVRPDGTPEQEFTPLYPRQRRDISYGVSTSITAEAVLLGDGHGARAFVPSDNSLGANWLAVGFDDSAWPNGTLGVGFENSPGSQYSYEGLIGLDVGGAMYDTNASAYIRVPFNVDDPLAYESLTLQMRFDDGFVAYLNGIEIARTNAPSTPAYDATATALHDDEQAVDFVDFDVTGHLGELVPGSNVLAVHGLNRDVTSSDFLVFPQLKAGGAGLSYTYQTNPTPGVVNSAGALGVVADTTFSVDRGFFAAPFEVAISSKTSNAEIRYTLDGTPPSETSGTVYTNPVTINGTTTLRAMAHRPGYLSTDVDTQTYIFPAQVLQQDGSGITSVNWGDNGPDWEMDAEITGHADPEVRPTTNDLLRLPALSIAMNWDEMFGSGGIYISGEGVERACSAELVDPQGLNEFQVDGSIQIVGGSSVNRWKSEKLSMRLKFTEQFGDPKLRHPVFGPDAAEVFDTLVIDARLNNVWHYGGGVGADGQRVRGQYVRDQYAADLHNAMDGYAPHGQSVLVYINGVLWGIHTLHERPDDNFIAAYLGGQSEEYDVLKHNHNRVVNGTDDAYDAMIALAAQDMSVLANYEVVTQVLDASGLADYLLLNYFIGNSDWAHQNWYASRRRVPGGLWRYHSWDAEHSLEGATQNVTTKDNAGGPTGVHNDLMNSEEYKILFNDRVQKHFFGDGVLTTSNAVAIYRARADAVELVSRVESARWGDNQRTTPYTRLDWLNERDRLVDTLLPGRNQLVLNQMAARGFLLSTPAPRFDQPGGVFSAPSSVTVTSSHAVYYTLDGSDPREYGTGLAVGTPYWRGIALTRSAVVRVRALNGSEWSPLVEAVFLCDTPAELRVSEVMCCAHRPEGVETQALFTAADFDFVELVNAGANTVGLAGLSLMEGVQFDFYNSAVAVLAPGEHAVVVSDLEAFRLRYPDWQSRNVAGAYAGDLDNGGERVTLEQAAVSNRYTFTYGNGRGWPLQADGAGHSLVPLADDPERLRYGGNWRASTYRRGSPGLADPAQVTDVLINEFAAHTDTTVPGYESDDWVELFAMPGRTVSTAEWFLSDDPDNLAKSVNPAAVVTGGAWWSISEIPPDPAPHKLGFGLNKDGEALYLSQVISGAVVRVADAVAYGGQENGATLGRYPDGDAFWQTLSPTRDAANRSPSPHIVIHEIMYHDLSAGTNEYVVLHNPLTWTVALTNAAGTWRLDGDIDFVFPPGTAMTAGGYLAVVTFHPTNAVAVSAFESTHGLAPGTLPLFGPCNGRLSNGGGRLSLERPQEADIPGEPASWVVVDEVIYSDCEPFPDSADGTGLALHRRDAAAAGSDPAAWQSGLPTLDRADIAWPPANLRVDAASGPAAVVSFDAATGFEYALKRADRITNAAWQTLLRVATNGTVKTTDAEVAAQRYYRLTQQE